MSKYNPELGVIAIGMTAGVAWLAGCLGMFAIAAGTGLFVSHAAKSKLVEDNTDAYADAEQALDDQWARLSESQRNGEQGKTIHAKQRQLAIEKCKDDRNAQTMGRAAGLGVFANPVVGGIGVFVANHLHNEGVRQRKVKQCKAMYCHQLPAEAIRL